MSAFTCKDCTKRTETCHVTCENYHKAREERDKLNEQKKKNHVIDLYRTGRRIQSRAKLLKKYGKSTV